MKCGFMGPGTLGRNPAGSLAREDLQVTVTEMGPAAAASMATPFRRPAPKPSPENVLADARGFPAER